MNNDTYYARNIQSKCLYIVGILSLSDYESRYIVSMKTEDTHILLYED